jgi:hypothetical protein
MHRGYIKVWRAIRDNPHWDHKPFEPARAWIDLLLLANYKDGIYRKRGNRIDVLRGQLAWSIKGLADKWGWSQGRVSRFLCELKDDGQIDYQKSNLTTLITITNYELYQGDGEQIAPQTGSRRGADGEQTETSKEVKEFNKKEKNKEAPPFTSYFPTDWQTHEKFVEWCDKWDEHRKKKRWPRTKLAYEAQAEKLLEYDIETAIRAIRDSIQGGWQGVFPKQERGNGATKPAAPTMTAEQEAKRNMLKNELGALYDTLESKKEVPEGHPNYEKAQRAIININKRIDEIEKELEG